MDSQEEESDQPREKKVLEAGAMPLEAGEKEKAEADCTSSTDAASVADGHAAAAEECQAKIHIRVQKH